MGQPRREVSRGVDPGSERALRTDGYVRPGWGTILSESRFEVAQIRGDSLFLIKDSFSGFQTAKLNVKKCFRKSFFLEIREGRCLIQCSALF